MADARRLQGAVPDRGKPGRAGGGFPRPVFFWAGAAACTAGALLHLPMYLHARHMGYHMAGMPMDNAMFTGMALVVVGTAAVIAGLLPRHASTVRRQVASARVRAVDDAPLRPAHVALLVVLSLAVTIDVMKPMTLSFVVPGVAKEYGLASPLNPGGSIPVSWLPLAGISGTMTGSFLWGRLGDRIGRRGSILLAGMLFATTAVCGAMPGFAWNVAMCFLMGTAAGGLIPIAFTLLAETIPQRHRGWLMVLIGGNVTLAYILTSWLAASLTPTYSWRILWLAGLPTGLLLILLNRWIPESPRYLLATGRPREAREVLARYGSTVQQIAEAEEEAEAAAARAAGPGAAPPTGYRRLFTAAFRGPTLALTVLAIGAGLMAHSFQMWLPTNLGRLGITEVSSDRVLRDSALISLPLNVLTALLYGLWSSRRTVITLTGLTATALVALAVLADSVAGHGVWLRLLLLVPLWGISATAAVMAAYSTEAYPTPLRARGTSWAAGISKAGGVAILALSVAAVAVPPLGVTALLGAVPLALAALAFALFGPETRGRRLDEIAPERIPARA
ncbi:MFS transporter [Streptomyces syringium]|uniref:MFS transporter n=1 Tax=Streptomyces syringium TaxID=76729 RepID=A0ABS4XXW2_9ACTN|nr:MFS transporter [Streptomyces syringium]MBP2401180.1 putative MFS transporter [Streptomyces syringium]